MSVLQMFSNNRRHFIWVLNSRRLINTFGSKWNTENGNKEVKRIDHRRSELHCLQTVKKFDYENFLATILIQNNKLRRTAFALRAFNVELAQIRDLTKSNSLSQIRFQFWLDLIDDIYSSKAETSTDKVTYNFPVAYELRKVLLESDLSKHWLRKLVTIRSDANYLSDFPFRTLDELEKYCEASVASLYYLLNEKVIELSGESNTGYRISLDHIANHLAKAQGLANILRGIKHNATYHRCYIPNDILLKYKCTHEDFLRGNSSDSTTNAIYELASQAFRHLEHCLELQKDLKTKKDDSKQIFLPYIAVQAYLDNLQRCHFDVFDLRLYQKNGTLPWKFWWRSKFS